MVSKTSARSRTHNLFLKLKKIAHRSSSDISPKAVHELRTTARRLETLLSTDPAAGDDSGKLARQLKKLRRRAGKLRDVDVHITALDGIRLDNAVADRRAVHDHLAKMRSKGEEKLARTLHRQVSKGFVKRLKRAEKELDAHSDVACAKDHTAEALDRFKALVDGRPPLTEKTLHDFRIDCKRIRYLAEMSGEMPDAEQVVSLLKSIQDAIGEWHDWLTLAQMAKEVLGRSASPLMATLRARTRSKFNEAMRVTAETEDKLLALHADLTDRTGTTASPAHLPSSADGRPPAPDMPPHPAAITDVEPATDGQRKISRRPPASAARRKPTLVAA